jgi:diguanylate cyclase (GGDEF)-like protein
MELTDPVPSTWTTLLNTLAMPAAVVNADDPELPIQLTNSAWRTVHSCDGGCTDRDDPFTLPALYRATSREELIAAVGEVRAQLRSHRTVVVSSPRNTQEEGRWHRLNLSRFVPEPGPDPEADTASSHLVLAIEQDITWEVLESSRLAQQAAVDPLTGVLARKPFIDELRDKLQRLTANQGAICLVFIDLNNFKPINDTYGHEVGDQILSQLGERLLSEMSPGNIAGRLGGDEFVLMLTGAMNSETIDRYLNGMASRIFQPMQISAELTLPVNGSFGYVCTQDARASIAELLKAADQAMYRAKQTRQISAVVAGEIVETTEDTQNRAEFLETLQADGLEMYLQPVLSGTQREIIGFEVLPRWQHPEYGLLELEHFHPMLVHSEEAKAYDRWLILTAAKLSAGFQEQGYNIGIGINLTRRQLDNGSFIEYLHDATALFPDGRVDLTLEIIESPHFLDDVLAFSALQQAREMGSQVVLDHFGSTSSSMAFASKVPLDFIKLHKHVCRDLQDNPGRQRYASALIAFAHGLGVSAVAAGIESEEDAAILSAMNCDLIQGNLWVKPMTMPEITRQILTNEDSAFSYRKSYPGQQGASAVSDAVAVEE